MTPDAPDEDDGMSGVLSWMGLLAVQAEPAPMPVVPQGTLALYALDTTPAPRRLRLSRTAEPPNQKENPMNVVSIIGRLTADPQSRAGENHESAYFRMAVDRRSAEGADFVDVVVFDRLAEVCSEHLAKGRQVAVNGRLRSSEWTTDAGERRSRLQVVADEVAFLDRPKAADDDAPVVEDRPAIGKYQRRKSA
jgi:single-strand DNA-binding protein